MISCTRVGGDGEGRQLCVLTRIGETSGFPDTEELRLLWLHVYGKEDVGYHEVGRSFNAIKVSLPPDCSEEMRELFQKRIADAIHQGADLVLYKEEH